MGANNSLVLKEDEISLQIIAALLHDVYQLAGLLTPRDCELDTLTCIRRHRSEGMSFLTKTLPRLGKAFDKALTGTLLDSAGFSKKSGSQLPIFMGGLFRLVFNDAGVLLPKPCPVAVRCIREILFVFYKYEIPYSPSQSEKVLKDFQECESTLGTTIQNCSTHRLIDNARGVLKELFSSFNPQDVSPKHGPGAVAEKLLPEDKWIWQTIPERTLAKYGIEFFVSGGCHMADTLHSFLEMSDSNPKARVILVPKDSRGPRLISSEPVVFQYIQQGLKGGIVDLVESHPLTRGHVNFTDQTINRELALKGSITGELATLDLKEASDRVSLNLVRSIFPLELLPYLESCRSEYTVLPCGTDILLRKFAPMGSALCFPILALTIFSVLVGAGIDPKDLYVYGDDVIVPINDTSLAITALESVGLLVNKAKSCYTGFFRESCGMDAFMGVCVTPIRIRTVWGHRPSASGLASWTSYQNDFFESGYTHTASVLREMVKSRYRDIPIASGRVKNYPSLMIYEYDEASLGHKPRTRWNKDLQRSEVRVLVPSTPTYTVDDDGWWKILRFFTETRPSDDIGDTIRRQQLELDKFREEESCFSASVYARKDPLLKRVWRASV